MKYLLLILMLSLAVTSFAGNGERNLHLRVTETPIILDGIIDAEWSKADSAVGFFQLQPYYGQPPSRRTVAKILTDRENLYAVIISYDDRENITQTRGKLDDFAGDLVSLMLDTFGDDRTAYKFAVSASGVRADCRLLDDARNRDYNWDGIWFAASKVYDWGFVSELQIPFKSIQYDESLSERGLDFDRWIPANTEDLYWCSYPENEGMRVSRFGRLILDDFRPSVKGLNLEIYPVAITRGTYTGDGKYDFDPNAGIDVFYNPSQKLTFQLTGNPDFAQVEADEYDFNISRYESYFDEQRPFFTEGNEVFMPSGRERNTGFYRPLELFYSRRIGKKLPDGSEVPLQLGTRAFGRINDMEYGGFVARTGAVEYTDDDVSVREEAATFTSLRLKKQIFENSSLGILYAGKFSPGNHYGVLDIDGAFRTSDWQLSYQVARSIENEHGDFAGSIGFTRFQEDWMLLARGRYIGNDFNVEQIGFVPWQGTHEAIVIGGPRWYYEDGYIRSILVYGGPFIGYEHADHFTDYGAAFGYNMQFRDNWGFEINASAGDSRDEGIRYKSWDVSLSSWMHTSPRWSGNVNAGIARTYNFSRDYLAYYTWSGASVEWLVLDELKIGTNLGMFIEIDPDHNIEDITYNTRPYFSLTPINNLNIRLYVDNTMLRSSGKLEQAVGGFLVAWNFSPKSWMYFALNEFRERDELGRMQVMDRAGVLKVRYLYYF